MSPGRGFNPGPHPDSLCVSPGRAKRVTLAGLVSWTGSDSVLSERRKGAKTAARSYRCLSAVTELDAAEERSSAPLKVSTAAEFSMNIHRP